MGLEFIQLWRRPAIHWPSDAGLRGATCFASKPGKAQRHPAEERCDLVIPIVFHVAFSAARPTIRPLHGMASGLSGDDFLLNARLQRLRFRQGQTHVGDIPRSSGLTISMTSVPCDCHSPFASTNRKTQRIHNPPPPNS
jgi:hypothetical protein